MREYTQRVENLLYNIEKTTSNELFHKLENELNTRITAVYNGKKIYGSILYTSRILVEDVILCSEYNVLRANYNYILFAIKLIKEKLKLETVSQIYRGIIKSAVESLSKTELKGVCAVFNKVEDSGNPVIISDIAKSMGITRSVIINGLKKIECTGTIELTSKGGHGTVVKIKYKDILNALKKGG